MKTKLLLLLLLVATATAVMGQNSPPQSSHIVKGILLDSLTQEAEPYATIRIVKKENPAQPVKMAVTDNKGKFQEKINGSGEFILTISSIGKNTVVKEYAVKAGDKEVDLGTLFTEDATNELGTVEVVAQKPLVKVDLDKIEYNIEDDPDSKTNSVLEMLRKVPLVTVDGEDKIQVNGSSNFKVHVNGKPNSMMSNNPTEVLKSMPANTIKHIEVITNPGPKYDAEGVGGILNIVTVGSGFEGYTVTLTGNATNRGGGGSVYGTVQKGKFTVTGNYNYNLNNQPRNYTDSERIDAEGNKLVNNTWTKSKGNYQYGNLEASYEVDTLRLISMSFGLWGGGNESYGQGIADYRSMASSSTTPLYRYNRLNDGESDWFSIRGNIDYQRSFKLKGRMLTFSYRINTQPQTSDNYTTYENIDGTQEWLALLRLEKQRADSETNTTEHTFQADYTTPIGEYHTIETGVKYISRNNTSDTKYYRGDNALLDNDLSVDYKHANDIFAAYGGYALRYKKFSGRAGLRYEHTSQDVKYAGDEDRNFSTSFNDPVPSASIGYKLGDTRNIRLAYNMRIWRPNIHFLNPYVDVTNPTNIRYGNPNLESEKNHGFNLSFSNFTQKFNINLSLRHSFTNNWIEQYSFLDENEIMHTTYMNIGKFRSSGMSAYINWNASPKTRVYINMNGSYNYFGVPAMDGREEMKNHGWQMFAYGGAQHTFPLDIRVSLNLMGSTPQVSLQGDGWRFFDYGININKSFLDKRLTVSAFGNNLFNKYTTNTQTINGFNFDQTTDYRYSRQRFGVSVSYRIGELKAQVKKAARSINNDDSKDGGGGGSGAS